MNAGVALILGVAGQDGSLLARFLLQHGYAVHGTSRTESPAHFGNLAELGIAESVRLRRVDPADHLAVREAISGIQPDEVYNLAALTSVALSFERPREAIDSSVLGTLNVLEAVRLSHGSARVFTAGSGDSFGETGDAGASEETPFRPRSPYGAGKAAAACQTRAYRDGYDLYACTGILFNHESTLRPARFVTRKIVSAAVRIRAGSSERLPLGALEVERDWGWAPEYVEAMWLMLQQAEPRDFVIATGQSHTVAEFAAAAFAEVGLDWQEHVERDPGLLRRREIQRSRGDPTLARELLGWRARSGMREVAAMMVAGESLQPGPAARRRAVNA